MEERFLFLMAKAQSKLVAFVKKELRKHQVAISAGQMGILFLVRAQDVSMGEIGKILEIDNSAVTRQVDLLEKAGMVERKMNARDRRQYLVHITQKGKAASEKAGLVVETVNQKIGEIFSASELDAFTKAIWKFYVKFGDE